MKSLTNYITEKLIINKNYTDVNFNLSPDKTLVRFILYWHADNGTYNNEQDIKDNDGWIRYGRIDTVNVESISSTNGKCNIHYSYNGNNGTAFDGTMYITDDKSFLYEYNKNGGRTNELCILFNYDVFDNKKIEEIIDLYDENEITEYADHYSRFKINSDDMKNMFGLDISKCKNVRRANYDGNYSFTLYKTKEYKNLKKYMESI